MPECPTCGESFDDDGSLNKHRSKSSGHEVPWHNKELLQRRYIERQQSSSEIAKDLGTTKHTICNWLKRHDIETRENTQELREKYQRKLPASRYFHKETGYIYLRSAEASILEHRLLAVAKYGIEAVKDMDVHHKNNIPWDNRPENIELMDKAEHAKHHRPEREIDELGRFC